MFTVTTYINKHIHEFEWTKLITPKENAAWKKKYTRAHKKYNKVHVKYRSNVILGKVVLSKHMATRKQCFCKERDEIKPPITCWCRAASLYFIFCILQKNTQPLSRPRIKGNRSTYAHQTPGGAKHSFFPPRNILCVTRFPSVFISRFHSISFVL